jgi:hypothetical protein
VPGAGRGSYRAGLRSRREPLLALQDLGDIALGVDDAAQQLARFGLLVTLNVVEKVVALDTVCVAVALALEVAAGADWASVPIAPLSWARCTPDPSKEAT